MHTLYRVVSAFSVRQIVSKFVPEYAQKRADPNPEGTPECLQGNLVSDGEWYADTVYVHYSTCIYEQDDPFMFLNLFAAVSCGML